MASRIQGITVEIGGDTTKLSKALESVNKSIKGTQSGLKDVNKLLKLDPSNTELVVQNQKMLKDAIEATKEKLASPFSCLNNFYFKILSSFLGSLHTGISAYSAALWIFCKVSSSYKARRMLASCGKVQSLKVTS